MQSGVLIPGPDSDEELDHAQVQSALQRHLQCADDPISQFSSPGDNKREPSEHNGCDLSSMAFFEQRCNQQPDVGIVQAYEGEPLGSSGPDGVPHAIAETPVVLQHNVSVEGEPLGSFSAELAKFADASVEKVSTHQSSLLHNQMKPTLLNCVSGNDTDPPPMPYALISLFDGCGSSFYIFKDAIGYPPQVFIAAEWDQHLRAIVADALGLSLDNNWRVNKFQSKSIYVSDVDDLFSNEARILRQFISLLPQNCRVFVIGGSPCTELTRGSSDQGLLGLAGPASCFFFTIHLLLFLLQSVLPQTHLRFLVENAGSLLPLHRDFIRWSLGIEATDVDHFIWEAKALGLADRKRFFFQNVFVPRQPLQIASERPFPQGWGPLPFYEGNKLQYVTAKVFMRPREEINDGLVQRSWSAYHPYSLIWNYSFFGSVHDLAAASRITNFSQIPQLPWHKFIPPMFLNAWHKFLKVIFNFKSTFREKDNAIFAVLPLFHNPRVRLPFRLITPQEAAIISGISRSFAHAKSFPFLKSEFVILSAVGNSFHPALISAALGTTQQLHAWLSGSCLDVLNVASPQQVIQRFPSYLAEIDKLIQGKPIYKHIVRTPYRQLNYEISLFRTVKPPAILPLQLRPSIPRQLQIAAVRAKTHDLRNRRLRAIDAEVANILSQSSLNDLLESWYSPLYHPLKDTVSVVMEGTGNKSVIADKAKRLASVSIQHRQSWDAVVMCLWSLFSVKDSEKNGASFICVFKSTSDPVVLLTYGTFPKDAYVVVQQPETCEIALASSDSFKLDYQAVVASAGSNVKIVHMPVVKAIISLNHDVEGFVLPGEAGSLVGASHCAGASTVVGCPLFFASCLYNLLRGTPDVVVSTSPCHKLCTSIPCAISLANIHQGTLTISKSLSRNIFDWESYTSGNSPSPLLLVLVFVNNVQEYQLGQVCAPTLQSPFVNSESVSVVSAWATADFRRHECGYTAVGALGAIICTGAVSQWALFS